MARFDYDAALATAVAMIADTGRQITMIRGAEGPADANDPLAGPGAPADTIEGVWATFVEPTGLSRLGISAQSREMFKTCEKIALIAGGAYDWSTFDFMLDDGANWKIEHVEELKPGEVAVLYYVGVRRP